MLNFVIPMLADELMIKEHIIHYSKLISRKVKSIPVKDL